MCDTFWLCIELSALNSVFCLATATGLAALCGYVTELAIAFDHTVIQQHALA